MVVLLQASSLMLLAVLGEQRWCNSSRMLPSLAGSDNGHCKGLTNSLCLQELQVQLASLQQQLQHVNNQQRDVERRQVATLTCHLV